MSEAKRDQNHVPTLLGVSSSDGLTPVTLWADPTTHRLLVDLPSGAGDVTAAANLGDNLLIRGDGAVKGVQNSGISIDDSDNMSGLGTLNSLTIPASDFVGLTDSQTLTNKTLTAPIIVDAGFIADANGNEQIVFQTTTSAVNHLEVTNAATGNSPMISVVGDDANIGMIFQVKGDESYKFKATASSPTVLELYEDTDNGTNHIEIKAPASLAAHQILTLPDATDTLVGKATTDTFTNKSGAISQWTNDSGYTTNTGDALVANPLSQFATTTSLQLKGVISDETGSGALVFATSPTLVTPVLGTPASGVMTNVTGTASGLTAGAVTGFTPASGSLTLSGADALTLTTTAATNVTLPTTGTLITNAVVTLNSLTTATALPWTGMKTGTDGEIPTFDASGNPAFVAVGTVDQVLTSNGVGAAPTFQAAGGGGAWEVIGDFTQSGDQTATFANLFSSIGTQYKMFRLTGLMKQDSSGNIIKMRLNGATGGAAYFGTVVGWSGNATKEVEGGNSSDRITLIIENINDGNYIIDIVFTNIASQVNGFTGTIGSLNADSSTQAGNSLIKGGLNASGQISSISTQYMASGSTFTLMGYDPA